MQLYNTDKVHYGDVIVMITIILIIIIILNLLVVIANIRHYHNESSRSALFTTTLLNRNVTVSLHLRLKSILKCSVFKYCYRWIHMMYTNILKWSHDILIYGYGHMDHTIHCYVRLTPHLFRRKLVRNYHNAFNLKTVGIGFDIFE